MTLTIEASTTKNKPVSTLDATQKAIKAVKERFVRVPSETTYPQFKDLITGTEQRDSGILADFYYQNAKGEVEPQSGKDLLYKLKWVYGESFKPNLPKYLEGNLLNLWKPHPFQYTGSVNAEEVPLFIEYMERMFPVEEQRHYMTWWIAHVIRRPEEKIISTPVLRSDQGTGKTFLVSTLLKGIMGKSAGRVSLNDIVGTFQDAIVGKTVLLIDEMFIDKRRTTDTLKTFQDGEDIFINRKGAKAIEIENYLNLICASNLRDPLYFEPSDRRFYFPAYIEYKVDQNETKAFIKKFALWLENEQGYQKVRNYLESVNLADYDHKDPAIWTDEKREFLGYSLDEQLKSQLEHLISGVSVVNATDLLDRLDLEPSIRSKVTTRKIAIILSTELKCQKFKTRGANYYVTPLGQEKGFLLAGGDSLSNQCKEDCRALDSRRDINF